MEPEEVRASDREKAKERRRYFRGPYKWIRGESEKNIRASNSGFVFLKYFHVQTREWRFIAQEQNIKEIDIVRE